MPVTHVIIPDVQAKDGNDFTYLKCLGNFIAEKKPDVIVCIGDFADMESLSSYDKGMKSFEGRSYQKDIWAAREAMDALLTPLFQLQELQRKNKHKVYKPRMVLTLGNHEHRINRVIDEDRKLDGLISVDDLPYQDWEVYNFLDVVVIDGIAYSHYFTSGIMGRPITSAQAVITKKHMSCFAGHQQGRQIAYGQRADGHEITAIISGSCLAPHHKVLTADLRYVELKDVKSGDKLVSFDEHLGMSKKRGRRYKTGTVLNTRLSSGELFDVTLSNGKVFRTTKDHKWLTKNCMGVTKWQETQNLTIDGKKGYGTKVSRVMPEWETLNTRQAGWLAGMYDGEGSLYARKTTGGNCTQLAISQCPVHNPDTVKELIDSHAELGFELGSASANGINCRQWRITNGQAQVAKFLGSVRPQRLLSKFSPELLGTLTTQYNEPLDSIISIKSVGIGEYVEIEIDAATMIVEGYPHHNCYEHEEAYLGAQGNKHWRGFYVLHDVDDGAFDEMAVSIRFLKDRYNY